MINLNFVKKSALKTASIAWLCLLTACGNPVETEHLRTNSPDTPIKNTVQRPNFLVIVVDDVGYSDLGIYGGEIETPNIDSLIKKGLMFANFYVAGTCSPTRSMLLSGVDHHRAGLGTMVEHIAKNQVGQPGYEGFLNDHVLTIAERLKPAGYNTYMVGKWHLGMTEETSPTARGFDKSFALLNGGANHFDQRGLTPKYNPAPYREDGKMVNLGDDFTYSGDFYTNKMIGYLDSNKESNAPFFAYLAYTAPHWPLQAPKADIAKYKGKYDTGWKAIQNARFARQKKMGLVPKDAVLPKIITDFPDWDALSLQERQYEARRMEIFAAMLDHVDRNIKEVISYLKSTGQYNNTVIVFVSDNGSEGAPLQDGPPFVDWMKKFDNSYESLGSKDSYIFLEERWAQVGNTPNRLYKGMTSDGGIRVPGAIVFEGAKNQANIYDGMVSVLDIAPTILNMAGVSENDDSYQGSKIYKLQGKDIQPLLDHSSANVRSTEEGLGWELFTKKGYRRGHWKAILLHEPWDNGQWSLYDLSVDPGETNNLSKEHPEILASLVEAWKRYATDNGVIVGNEPPER